MFKHILDPFLIAHHQDCLYNYLYSRKRLVYFFPFGSVSCLLFTFYLFSLIIKTLILVYTWNFIQSYNCYILYLHIIFHQIIQCPCQVWCLSINCRYIIPTYLIFFVISYTWSHIVACLFCIIYAALSITLRYLTVI